jgi:hypothetical protein
MSEQTATVSSLRTRLLVATGEGAGTAALQVQLPDGNWTVLDIPVTVRNIESSGKSAGKSFTMTRKAWATVDVLSDDVNFCDLSPAGEFVLHKTTGAAEEE